MYILDIVVVVPDDGWNTCDIHCTYLDINIIDNIMVGNDDVNYIRNGDDGRK